jgi:hypothetical protein
MTGSLDVVLFASRHGLVVKKTIVDEVMGSIDRSSLESEERKRYEVLVWDGNGEPPIGTRDRWVHEDDDLGKAAKTATESPEHCLYFLMKDGQLHHFQPVRAFDRGYHMLHYKDENHEHHWKKASEDHIRQEIEGEIDQKVLRLALEKTLELHEQRGIPLGMAPVKSEGV